MTGSVHRVRLGNTRSRFVAAASPGGAFSFPISPPFVILQNLNNIDWTPDPGGFRGTIVRNGPNVWDGKLYANPGFTGVLGQILYGCDFGPVPISNQGFAFAPRVNSPNLGNGSSQGACIRLINTTTYGNCMVLCLSPQVTGFLSGDGWVALPSQPPAPITGASDIRNVIFNWPLVGASDRAASDLRPEFDTTAPTFGGNWVL